MIYNTTMKVPTFYHPVPKSDQKKAIIRVSPIGKVIGNVTQKLMQDVEAGKALITRFINDKTQFLVPVALHGPALGQYVATWQDVIPEGQGILSPAPVKR